MQVAADLADGLDYVHNKTGLYLTLVHNHINSSSIIITEPDLSAKLCHFGTAQLCGEAPENEVGEKKKKKKSVLNEIREISEEDGDELQGKEDRSKELKRSNSGSMQFEGVRGYMSPEFQASGIPTQKSDVYAFGVVILELLSGEEPFKYKYSKSRGDFTRTSLIETAKAVIDGGVVEDGEGREGRDGRLRRWIDRRMKDSFPVEVAEKLVRLALECVHVEEDKRPDMSRVAGKISKLYLASKAWSEKN
ncbi:protein LYK5-like isoform X1 [Euphorbia lathyris]|uniref:protein LYK5-like isoform X1 n=1 Tax=Euphorbia lathyris TaxID=212925 RepID=UPI003313465C